MKPPSRRIPRHLAVDTRGGAPPVLREALRRLEDMEEDLEADIGTDSEGGEGTPLLNRNRRATHRHQDQCTGGEVMHHPIIPCVGGLEKGLAHGPHL